MVFWAPSLTLSCPLGPQINLLARKQAGWGWAKIYVYHPGQTFFWKGGKSLNSYEEGGFQKAWISNGPEGNPAREFGEDGQRMRAELGRGRIDIWAIVLHCVWKWLHLAEDILILQRTETFASKSSGFFAPLNKYFWIQSEWETNKFSCLKSHSYFWAVFLSIIIGVSFT